ncbi:MAG: hemerythrin [Actinomycetota bacterium]
MSDLAAELDPHENPAGWPTQVVPIMARALTCRYASLTRSGQPITWPVTPYLNDDHRSVDVSTGVTYPAKAERARRNPNVSLLFDDAVGLTLDKPPTVLVLGKAAVRDADLQANTDRYLQRSWRKLPAVFGQVPWPLFKAQAWYWTRIWIEVTPLRILWWQHDRLDEAPRSWEASGEVELGRSDPAPAGSVPGPWQRVEGAGWREHATRAIGRIGRPSVTFVRDGWPLSAPVSRLRAAPDGFVARLPRGLPCPAGGPACITFQTHAEKFVGQDNAAFLGDIVTEGDRLHFVVARRLGDFVLPGGLLSRTRHFLGYGRRLSPRLEAECRRRDQGVPQIRHPRAL